MNRLPALLLVLSLLTACLAPPLPVTPSTSATEVARQPGMVTATPWAYAPPPEPTATPTPWPYVPPPTASPWPSPPPTATTVPPAITQDVLLLREGQLVRWNHMTGAFEVLVGPEPAGQAGGTIPVALLAGGPGPEARPGAVVRYVLDPTGRRAVLQRTVNYESGQFGLALFDLATRETTVIVQPVQVPLVVYWPIMAVPFVLSPDGQWLAYLVAGEQPAGTRSPGLTAPRAGNGPKGGTLYAVRLEALDTPIPIGVCTAERSADYIAGCEGFAWSPDSRGIMWTDSRGVWYAEPGQSPRSMRSADRRNIYAPAAWSPQGRYVLMWGRHYEGGSQCVLDTVGGRVECLKSTFAYATPGGEAAWLPDGRLLLVVPADMDPDGHMLVQVVRVDPGDPAFFVIERNVATSVGLNNYPTGLDVLPDGRATFVLYAFDVNDPQRVTTEEGGLYLFDRAGEVLTRVTGLPALGRAWSQATVVWSLDRDAALVAAYKGFGTPILYAPADGSTPVDLQAVVGMRACCFAWVR